MLHFTYATLHVSGSYNCINTVYTVNNTIHFGTAVSSSGVCAKLFSSAKHSNSTH